MRCRHVAILAGILSFDHAGLANAGGFAIREQSAYGQGSGFSGAAAPGPSISSMFWNPATVTTATGVVVEGGLTGVFPQSELDVDRTRSTLTALGILENGGNVGQIGAIPNAYVAVPLNERVYLGLSINMPYALATTSSLPWVGMFSHEEAKVLSVNVSPVVGIKINEMISVALGLQVQYFDVDIESALAPTASPPHQHIEGDDYGLGWVAGITLTPVEGTSLGFGYRSKINQSLDGTQSFDIPVAGGLIPAGRYRISADITLPETLSIGLRQEVSESVALLAGMEWTNWSRIQTVSFNGSPARSNLALNYDDGWYFTVGTEYQYNPNLTLRGGIGYEIAPTQDEDRSMRLPDADRIWASVGASYSWDERLSIDFGYSHLFVQDASVDETSAGVRYAGTAEGSVDIVSFGLRYKFGG